MKAMNRQQVLINKERLIRRIEEMAQFGLDKQTGGVNRQLGSEADKEVRGWLQDIWKNDLNLQVTVDPIANMWGHYAGHLQNKPIVFGSHHDSVPNGGKYDGALGVLMAMEAMQSIREQHINTRHPLEIISFTGEEPNSFSVSTLGSKVLCGRLTREDILKLHDRNTEQPLVEAIDWLGGDSERIDEARLSPNMMTAFLEFHIEQGQRLFRQHKSVAAVTCITGIYREIITITGEANHAGTTQLQDRRDALCAAGEVVLAIENLMKEFPTLAVTVGRIQVKPNSSNIIPGKVVLTMDLRTAYPQERAKALTVLKEKIAIISEKRKVQIKRELNLDQAEVPMDRDVINAILQACDEEYQSKIELVSMAGHDAANMARLTKVAMLFAQSVDGYSHCPREYTKPEDICIAAQVYLDTLLILDEELK